MTDSGAGQVYVGGGTVAQVIASISGVGLLVVDPTNGESYYPPLLTNGQWHNVFMPHNCTPTNK